jgi:DNA-binding winged helix-turn-helix (wHTH) protein
VLIRLFRGVIRLGEQDRMLRVLHDHVLPHLDEHPDVLSSTLALPLGPDPPGEYLLETHWRGIDDLVRFAGDEWRTPRVEPCEEDLLVSVSALHYVTSGLERPTAPELHPSPDVVWLDGVGIDGPAFRMTWNGSALHVPPREMGALLALASRAGSPVPTVELARRIWPGSVLVGPYDVRRVIHRLRTLLRSTGAPLRIRNLHGRGYGLERARPGERETGDSSGTPFPAESV